MEYKSSFEYRDSYAAITIQPNIPKEIMNITKPKERSLIFYWIFSQRKYLLANQASSQRGPRGHICTVIPGPQSEIVVIKLTVINFT